ncbi:MAG TPA: ATP-binding protein [Nitrososphaeraceae archaeon]|nr:ATP-binding protein [Nitrososphaeraceae archaeon]
MAAAPAPYEEQEEEKTELLYGVEDAVGRGDRFMKNVKRGMDLFGEKNGPSIIMEFDVYRNNYIDVIKRGGKIRFITEVTNENLHYCKELKKIVTEMRHLDGLVGGIAVSESEYMSTTTLREKQLLTQVFYSNAKEIVRHGQYIFDTFWNKAIPVEERFREIEEGIKPSFIETIRDASEVQNIAFDLVGSAREQILIIFSTANAFFRQEHVGALTSLNEAAKRGVIIKILVPYDERIQELIKSPTEINYNTDNRNTMKDIINIRFLEPKLQTRISILVVDREFSLTAELKDDAQSSSLNAIGLSSYSNSKATVLSYASIFETLWKQAEMYEQLKDHDRMQKEFINIAAHELRNPIQPIIGLSDLIRYKKGDIEQYAGLIDVILRNAKRLQRLTEDILDVSRIENRSLRLSKEKFSLRDMIEHATAEYKGIKIRDKRDIDVRLNISASNDDNILVYADRERIARVIDNLLINAIKFTKEGAITVTITTTEGTDRSDKRGKTAITNAVVSIMDSGEGIDPQIYPRLFTKFATTSHVGTGLGLFISKNIIEAHGGKIWAQNNSNGRGATFSFSLPSTIT